MSNQIEKRKSVIKFYFLNVSSFIKYFSKLYYSEIKESIENIENLQRVHQKSKLLYRQRISSPNTRKVRRKKSGKNLWNKIYAKYETGLITILFLNWIKGINLTIENNEMTHFSAASLNWIIEISVIIVLDNSCLSSQKLFSYPITAIAL